MDKTTCYFLGFCAVVMLLLLGYMAYVFVTTAKTWHIMLVFGVVVASYSFGRLIYKWTNGEQ